jgi:DNA-binding CsgD family transcriptional regulator
MASLSRSDYRHALEVLHRAADVDGDNPFPEPVLEAIRRLVPCDVVAYHDRRDHLGAPEIVFTGQPRGPMTPEIRAAHRRFLHEDPLLPVDGAVKYSDFLSRRQYHRLGLYQQVDRPLGIEYMMRLWLDPHGAGGARLEFDRAGPDFNERDRAVLHLLLPHLKQFRRRAIAARRLHLRRGGAESLITPREREILEHIARGRTNAQVASLLLISPDTVRKHLENAYRKLGVHTRTGAVAALSELDSKA